jgi:uncharacterized membrane protein YgcG
MPDWLIALLIGVAGILLWRALLFRRKSDPDEPAGESSGSQSGSISAGASSDRVFQAGGGEFGGAGASATWDSGGGVSSERSSD